MKFKSLKTQDQMFNYRIQAATDNQQQIINNTYDGLETKGTGKPWLREKTSTFLANPKGNY